MKLLINVLALIILLFIVGCSSFQVLPDRILLRQAIKTGDEKTIRRLIDNGADVNMLVWDDTPLLYSVSVMNKPDLVKLLLDKGAKVNVKNIQGNTPLLNAACGPVDKTAQQQKNALKIAEMLLKHGADPNLGTDPPLIDARKFNNFAMVRLLVEYGADVNIKDRYKCTPLMAAGPQISEFLINKGANVNAQDYEGVTVLMKAWRGQDNYNVADEIKTTIKTMKFLIEKGANVNAVAHPNGQEKGETVLDQEIRYRDLCYKFPKDIVNFLRAHGAKTADELGVNAKLDESSGSNSASDKETSKAALNDSNPKTSEPNMQMSSDTAKAPAVMQIVQAVEKKLLKIKGYTAKVERQILDVNGGFDKFIEEQTVRCPNQMLVKGKVAAAHNKENVGNSITTVIDGSNLYSHSNNKYYNDAEKKSFKEIEQAGGPSLRLFMAYMGNLADPFTIYKLETLKLESETAKEWVLTAEYKQLPAMPYWLPRWTNRITIDKKSGLIKKLEALIKELEEPVILLDVKSVSTFSDASDIPESIFKVDSKTDGKL